MVLAFWMRCAMLGALLTILLLVPGPGGRNTLQRWPLWARAGLAAAVLIFAFIVPDKVIGRTLVTTYPKLFWLIPVGMWTVLVAAMAWRDGRRPTASH